MEAFLAYIAEHWLEWLFAIITALAAWGYRSVSNGRQVMSECIGAFPVVEPEPEPEEEPVEEPVEE